MNKYFIQLEVKNGPKSTISFNEELTATNPRIAVEIILNRENKIWDHVKSCVVREWDF